MTVLIGREKQPECFGNYPHRNFCFNARRQHTRICTWRTECFERAANTLYYSKKTSKCKCCEQRTNAYIVENIYCCTMQVNPWIPSLSKTSDERVEWIEHRLCPEHMKGMKLRVWVKT